MQSGALTHTDGRTGLSALLSTFPLCEHSELLTVGLWVTEPAGQRPGPGSGRGRATPTPHGLVASLRVCSGMGLKQAEMLRARARALGENRSHFHTNLEEPDDDCTRLTGLGSVSDQRRAPLQPFGVCLRWQRDVCQCHVSGVHSAICPSARPRMCDTWSTRLNIWTSPRATCWTRTDQ